MDARRPGKFGGAWSRMNGTPPKKKTKTMNELSRWDPFRRTQDMQHRLSSVLGRQTQRRHEGGRESITVAEWAPWLI